MYLLRCFFLCVCGFFNTRVSLWESAFRESDPPVSASGVQHAAPGLNQPEWKQPLAGEEACQREMSLVMPNEYNKLKN